MPDALPPESALIGGWFGDDGVSTGDEQPFIDGWFGGPMSCQDIADVLNHVVGELIAHKPIYINNNGDLEELKLFMTGP